MIYGDSLVSGKDTWVRSYDATLMPWLFLFSIISKNDALLGVIGNERGSWSIFKVEYWLKVPVLLKTSFRELLSDSIIEDFLGDV